MKKFLSLTLALVAIMAMYFAPEMVAMINPEMLSTEVVTSAYVAVSIARPGGNAGAGGDKRDYLALFRWEDVQTLPARDANGVVIPGTIVMKPGKYMVKIYTTPTSISATNTTEGDADAKSFMHAVVANHPGSRKEILEFVQNITNENVGIIVFKCSENAQYLYGTPCAPLQLNNTGTDDNEQNIQEMNFEATVRSKFVPAIYEGTLTLESPLATIAADVTDPSVALGSGQYQLTNNTTATVITTLEDAVDGGVYTLLGSGGSNPSEITGGDFLLKNGTSWDAFAGSQITFRAFKDGASSFKFIELSRS
jgi:hypothetical protein